MFFGYAGYAELRLNYCSNEVPYKNIFWRNMFLFLVYAFNDRLCDE